MSSTSKDRDKKRTVPKFSSFKPEAPKPTPKPEKRDGSPNRQENPRPSHRRHEHDRKREREPELRGTHREERREERRRSPSRSAKHTAPHAPPVQAAPKTTPNDVFYFDRRGDPLILRYGSNERGKVPTYYRFGAGKTLGTTGRLIIHHEGARDTFSIQDRYRPGRGSVFRDKTAIKEAAARWSRTKYVKPSATPAATLPAASDDFIALEPPKKRRRGDDEPSVVRDFRSIFGKNASGESDSESDDDMSQSEDEGEVPEMTTTKKRSIELSRRVRAEPTDISSWLKLIGLQDDLFRENQGEKLAAAPHLRTEAETRGLAELKVSLYEEALSHATEAPEREGLVEAMMREGARAWNPKTLAKRWDDVSEKYPGSFSLWRARLDHELGKPAACTYEDIRDFIVKKLRQLLGRLSEACASEDGPSDLTVLSGQLIYVFLRLTRFLQDAGYLELAVATWQAMLEMTFCRPRSLPEKEEVLTEFSDFWETEVPRIGEEDAKGWSYFVDDANGATQETRTKPKTLVQMPQTRDMFKAWAIVEKQTAAASRMPAFTMDEDAQDDPFRVVMFSDIKDFLVWLPSKVLATARPHFLDAFLLFCGLPTAQLSDGLVDAAQDDPFVAVRSEAFETSLSQAELGKTLEEKKTPEFRHQGGRMAISLDVLFPGDSWFRYLDKWERTLPESRVEPAWVLATLRHLVLRRGIAELAQYYLALEWVNEPAGARKVAKSLLKAYSTDAGLYSAYALIESANQNVDMAEKVLSSATNLVTETTKSQFLWNTWAWIYLDRGQTETALIRLCSSIDRTLQTRPSPAVILKARSHFASTRDYALSSRALDISIHHAESLALLEYLTSPDPSTPTASPSQGNLPAAITTLTTFSTDLLSRNLPPAGRHHSLLLQLSSRLLLHHATHGPFRPTTLLSHLVPLLTHSPSNPTLLELLAFLSAPALVLSPLSDPVRAALHKPATLAAHRLAIAHELRAGTTPSARAAFEAALASDACRGSAEVWGGYVRFCAAAGVKGKVLKGVVYRAMEACRWDKGVYMEAFAGRVVGAMEGAELRGVVGVMGERGVRVCVDWEGWEGRWGRKRLEG
ncbi:NRDE-2, necessary for RNA interference-domain-containing protein [Podospora conica]|nr:NRDE-2, necessary for RNA interference-domain-containing protein [Schizothecium conicum]